MGQGFGCAFSGTVERHCWPNSLYLHDVEWNTSEQILKHGPDVDAVAMHAIDPCSPSNFVEMDDEGLPCYAWPG